MNGMFKILCSLAFCLLSVSLFGCRSFRSSTEETHGESYYSFREASQTDSLRFSSVTGENSKDSAEVRADERSVIKITRDSVGRIVEINSTKIESIRANLSGKNERSIRLSGVNASRSSEVADSIHSITTEKKETTKEIKAGLSLEFLITGILSVILIACFISEYIYRIWKRKQGK